MSDANEKKSESKQNLPELGEIAFSDSGDVPGVTQLLTPALMKGRKNQSSDPSEDSSGLLSNGEDENLAGISFPPEVEAMDPDDSSTPASPMPTRESSWESILRDSGVKFELIFSASGPVMRFESHQESQPGNFEAWRQEFYSGMKLDLKILGVTGDFHEFHAKTTPLVRECFGVREQDFLLFIRDQNQIRVWIADRSLIARKTQIVSLLGSKSAPPVASKPGPAIKEDHVLGDDGGLKIEIA